MDMVIFLFIVTRYRSARAPRAHDQSRKAVWMGSDDRLYAFPKIVLYIMVPRLKNYIAPFQENEVSFISF